jgi:hypothetical protein
MLSGKNKAVAREVDNLLIALSENQTGHSAAQEATCRGLMKIHRPGVNLRRFIGVHGAKTNEIRRQSRGVQAGKDSS